MRNRNEKLIAQERKLGVQCDWKWTSSLHLPQVFPLLGTHLMKRALSDWPISLREAPSAMTPQPRLTFVLGHRGKERIDHLKMTLKSIAAQVDASFECIVVEQSPNPECQNLLPQWVRYHHDPVNEDSPYNRSRAFNVGAGVANGNWLILHDGDILVPQSYGAEVLQLEGQGYEVVNLKRFIFHLAPSHTQRLFAGERSLFREPPGEVMQNAQGGASIAIKREAFLEIGGFDEAFVGWGGEDNEFWERAQSRKLWPYGYLPMVHLWHPPQPGKQSREQPTLELYRQKSLRPVQERIADLRIKMNIKAQRSS